MHSLQIKHFWMVLLFVATPFLSRSLQILNQYPFSAKSIQINHSVADVDGNIVACGYFYGNSANLNGTTLNALHPIVSGIFHRVTGFVAKLSRNGTVLWLVPIHGNRFFQGYLNSIPNPIETYDGSDIHSHTLAQYVAVASNGDVFVAGNTGADTLKVGSSEIVINPTPVVYPFSPNNNMNSFITKISSAGVPSWVRVLKGDMVLVKDIVSRQNKLHCLVQGRIFESLPAPGFVSQAAEGLRMVSISSSGAIEGESPTNDQVQGSIFWSKCFPSDKGSESDDFYLPVTYSTVPSVGPTNSVEKGKFQKYNVAGTLVAEEKTSAFWPDGLATFGLSKSSDGGYFVSHGAISQQDTTSIFQNIIQIPAPNVFNYMLHKFTADGCKEWSRSLNGPLYNLISDSEGSVYGLVWRDTIPSLSQAGIGFLAFDGKFYGGSPMKFNRSGCNLVKYNRRGSKIVDMPLTMFLNQDTLIPWYNIYLNDFQTPITPISITCIKNDTITLAGGKVICHIKDLSADSVFTINPPVCDPKVLFRPLVLANQEEWNANELTLAPNPVQSVLSIRMSEKAGERARFRITDLLGKTILSQDFRNFSGSETLDLQAIRSGVYLIQMDLGGQKVTRKFLKE